MPSFAVECFAGAMLPPDNRPPGEWGEENVKIPNSARTRNFHRDTTRWLLEPLERSVDPAVKRLVVMGPTGGSKTTIIDVRVPFGIANSLGSMLIGMQDDPFADLYCKERLWPILKDAAPVQALLPTGRGSQHKVTKNNIVFDHLTLTVGGSGKSNAQGISRSWVCVDEAWMIKVYGRLAEFEARLHDRWNGQICVLSQGGNEEEELDDWWKLTDKAELSWRCPECKHVQPFVWRQVRYETIKGPDGAVDFDASGETARDICQNAECGAAFADTVTNRRAMVESLPPDECYIPTAKGMDGYCGRHFNALALYWVPRKKLVAQWLRAMEALEAGDPTAHIQFIQKRLAETYKRPKQENQITLTAAKYLLANFANGEKIDGEAHRFLLIDVQLGHYWALCRAVRADGSSRLIHASKIEVKQPGLSEKELEDATERELVALQKRLGVPDRLTFLDCNWEPGRVFDMCVRHDWTALEGDKAESIIVTPKGARKPVARYYSTPKPTSAPSGGTCRRIVFSRVKVTDEAVRLRSGKGPAWEHGEDTPADWHKHLWSEQKEQRTGSGDKGKPVFTYVRIRQRRNDLWWCEVAATLCAIMLDLLRPAALEIETETVSEEAPEPP